MATLNHSLLHKRPRREGLFPRKTGGIDTLLRLPAVWLRRAGQRQQLRREIGSDPERLQRLELDIGLPPGTLRREMAKPFWIA